MSRNVLSQKRDPDEYLNRMLNKTTLTTQVVNHADIIRVGDELLKRTFSVKMEEEASKETDVVEQAEIRAAREMRAAMKRLKAELETDKKKSLDAQKKYYQKLGQKVNQQRDNAEEERRRELRRGFDREKEDLIQYLKEEAEREKQEAVRQANQNASANFREEFDIEKREAIAAAMKIAEKEKERAMQVTAEETREICRMQAEKTAKLVNDQHQTMIDEMERKFQNFKSEYDKELLQRNIVEKDFKNLQSDYRHFMDYTDGKYHSDYMMVLRKHGMELATKQLALVKHDPNHLNVDTLLDIPP